MSSVPLQGDSSTLSLHSPLSSVDPLSSLSDRPLVRGNTPLASALAPQNVLPQATALTSEVTFAQAQAIGGFPTPRSANQIREVTVDLAGNVYTTGYFQGTADFDPGAGVAQLTSLGEHDIYLTKSDPSGNLFWAKRIGGLGQDFAQAIRIDATGNIYLAGGFADTVDFDPGVGVTNLKATGTVSIFVSKLDANGNLLWAKTMEGSELGYVTGIEVDSTGNVYTTGEFSQTVDFDPGAGSTLLTSSGETDIFVSKLDSTGNFVWAKSVGGNFSDSVKALALDTSGNLYITGDFQGTADFDPGTAVVNLSAGSSASAAFITKLDGTGNLVWSKQLGGLGASIGGSRVFSYAIQVDNTDNVYTAGSFFGTADFDPGAGITTLTGTEFSEDIFISKLDATGNFVWVKQIGNSGADAAIDLRVDSASSLYVTGRFSGTVDFDPSAATKALTSAGQGDVFVGKFASDGSLLWVKGMGGNATDIATGLHLDQVGSVYTVGYFRGSADFDPGAAAALLEGGTTLNFFLSKLSSVPPNLEMTWHNPQTGELVLWQLNGLTYAQGSPITLEGKPVFTGTGWQMHGLHDFDGDGKKDWLWRNRGLDTTVIWLMNGNAIKSSQEIRLGSNTGDVIKPGVNWELKGMANFTNSPSGMRLVWRDMTTGAIALWGLTGTFVNPTITGAITVSGNPVVPGSQWELLSFQDVDRDGKADLIWNDRTFGVIVVGKMDGSAITATAILSTPTGSGWKLAAIGDINRSGQPELLWQNFTTNEIAVSTLSGLTVTGTTIRSSILTNSDRLTAIQDINGDGQMELIWSNSETGKVTFETVSTSLATVTQIGDLPVLGIQWQLGAIDELIV
jgi:hypothetical protein